MLPLIATLLIITLLDAVQDWYLITRKKRQIRHAAQAWLSLAVYAAALGVWTSRLGWIPVLSVAMVWPSVRWILHDLLLNAFRGLDWDYLAEGPNAAWTDNMLTEIWYYDGWHPMIIKTLVLAFSLILSCILTDYLTHFFR